MGLREIWEKNIINSMKWILLILLIFNASVLLRGQNNKTDRDEARLNGTVSSIRSSDSEYAGENISGEGFMKTAGDVVFYDRGGQETERILVSDFGEAMGKLSRSFDNTGRLVETRWIDPKGKLLKRDVFNYSNGSLKETLTFNRSGILIEKIIRENDDNGRLVADVYYSPTKPVARTVYKYATGESPVEMAFFLADGGKATAPVGPCLGAHRITVEYNERGQIIAQSAFEADGTVNRWKYDDSGNIIEYFTESPGSSVRVVYKYEFDAKGNWTKRIATGTSLQKGPTVFGESAVPYVRSTVTTRKITYY